MNDIDYRSTKTHTISFLLTLVFFQNIVTYFPIMAMTPQQEALICRVFDAYLSKHHHDDILLLVDDDGDETHHPVVVNAMTLFEVNMEVTATPQKK